MEKKMFDTPVLPRLATILAEVKSGDLVVPRFQRPFVWDDDRRLNLLDSIAQGMPIGSLLVWRTSRKDLETYESVGGIRLGQPAQADAKINYLLDGHQRISTLFGALYPDQRERASTDDETRWPLYCELGATQRPAFRIKPKRATVPEDWMPLDILLDGDRLFDFTQRLRQAGKRDLAKEAEKLANVFRDYIIPIVPLVTEELDTVTDAFVRINNQGKGMSEAHMLRALTHLDTIDTDQRFKEVLARLEAFGWGRLDQQILVNVLKCMFGLDVYGSDVRRLREELKQNPGALDTLGDAMEQAVASLAEIGVRGPSILPYAYQLVSIATIAARAPERLAGEAARDKLRRWLWVTTYSEHFTGMKGSGIRDNIESLMNWLGDNASPPVLQEEVEPLEKLRTPSVRARAFDLFLAQLPEDAAARRRRQELIATDGPGGVGRLIAKHSIEDPANRVIATAEELRAVRAALRGGPALTSDLAAELAVPDEALRALPDQTAFLEVRRTWLRGREEELIDSLQEAAAPGQANGPQ